MTSILTNTAAMSALSSLTNTQSQLSKTQAQISSGLAVANASDNEAYWSIATEMKARVASLAATNQGLAVAQSILSVANSGMDSIRASVVKIHDDLVVAQQAGVDLSSVQSDISSQQESIKSALDSSSFNGVNLLKDVLLYNSSLAIDQNGFDPNGGGQSYITTAAGINSDGTTSFIKLYNADISQYQYYSPNLTSNNYDTADRYFANDFVQSVLGFLTNAAHTSDVGFLHLDITNLSQADLSTMSSQVSRVIDALSMSQATTGATMKQVANQISFNSSLSDALTSGIGSLVDVDMNIASTRLQALQMQQQLGIQALSMANQNSQLILKLFQAA
ncbi:flagellin [Lichenibacterium ramalinae]|uniref:Flagellin n=1 Tax=Lichenibacterium ramalinae TaxID=2316527 RepID=A0A4Q2RHY4_9HYPH|nr:flagellin [Lichenibacterium ramalinae]RYB05728.1 hypothetical protein D3272_09090 [Lichenibacterium ramalinae]